MPPFLVCFWYNEGNGGVLIIISVFLVLLYKKKNGFKMFSQKDTPKTGLLQNSSVCHIIDTSRKRQVVPPNGGDTVEAIAVVISLLNLLAVVIFGTVNICHKKK